MDGLIDNGWLNGWMDGWIDFINVSSCNCTSYGNIGTLLCLGYHPSSRFYYENNVYEVDYGSFKQR
jgi:hypothetical protein